MSSAPVEVIFNPLKKWVVIAGWGPDVTFLLVSGPNFTPMAVAQRTQPYPVS